MNDAAPHDRAASPRAHKPAYIDPSVRMFGDVALAEGVNVWPYAVIRCEVYKVRIGRFTNIQDHVMIHVGEGAETIVGDYCSITHRAVLHGCTIGDNCLIGIGAVLMDRVVVGENSIIAGGSFLKEDTVIPANSIVMGLPGKVVRTRNNFVANRINALMYHENGLAYARGEHRFWSGPQDEVNRKRWRQEAEAAFKATYGAGMVAD